MTTTVAAGPITPVFVPRGEEVDKSRLEPGQLIVMSFASCYAEAVRLARTAGEFTPRDWENAGDPTTDPIHEEDGLAHYLVYQLHLIGTGESLDSYELVAVRNFPGETYQELGFCQRWLRLHFGVTQPSEEQPQTVRSYFYYLREG